MFGHHVRIITHWRFVVLSKQPIHMHDTSQDMKLSIVMQTSDGLRYTTSGECVIEDTAVRAITPARAASIDSRVD